MDYFNNLEENRVATTSQFVDFIQSLAVFAVIMLTIFLFIAQPHKVSGPSMYPTFHDNDYIITDKLTYRFSPPRRGDIIVFQDPQDHSKDFIKRIIGLPGERIKIQNNQVYINNQLLPEPFIPSSNVTFGGKFLPEDKELIIGTQEYFVMGDNREHSSDSRDWGPIKKDEIIGRVLFRYWPISSLSFLPGEYSFTR